ncbi:MAG: nuclear transport factor 2 family protein, partial [Pseudomonadota bacterium]
ADDGVDENKGALSSHRIISTATHARDGVYGKATGKQLRYRILADCHAVGQTIDDEWLIRDQGAIVRQLGWTPEAYAADLIAREGGAEQAVRPFHPGIDQAGPYSGRGNDHELGEAHAELLSGIMAGDMALIPARYDRAAHLEYPGGVTGHGWGDADKFWMSLRAALPEATFEIHHQIGREDEGWPPRSAVRWSLTGRHTGWGGFGTPTGADVHVMGISHAEWGPWGLRREWTLFDETAVWKQILLGTA